MAKPGDIIKLSSDKTLYLPREIGAYCLLEAGLMPNPGPVFPKHYEFTVTNVLNDGHCEVDISHLKLNPFGMRLPAITAMIAKGDFRVVSVLERLAEAAE